MTAHALKLYPFTVHCKFHRLYFFFVKKKGDLTAASDMTPVLLCVSEILGHMDGMREQL